MKKSMGRQLRGKPKVDPNRYPKGWDRKRVQDVIDYYDNQSDDDAIAEADAACHAVGTTMMQVPVELVPQVLKLIAIPPQGHYGQAHSKRKELPEHGG